MYRIGNRIGSLNCLKTGEVNWYLAVSVTVTLTLHLILILTLVPLGHSSHALHPSLGHLPFGLDELSPYP